MDRRNQMKPFRTILPTVLIAGLSAFSSGIGLCDDVTDGSGDYVSQAAPKGPNAGIPPGQYGLIAFYADRFFSDSVNVVGAPPNAYRQLSWNSTLESDLLAGKYFVVDVRQTQPFGTRPGYCQGHFPGAVNIPFQNVAKPASLALLPANDKPILVYCYSGLISAEVSAVLTILGYNAFYLNGGVGSIPPEYKGEMCQ